MEKRNLILFSFITCLFFFVASLNLVVASNFSYNLKMVIPYYSQKDLLVVHAPILIDSNNDFTAYSSQGNGSQATPYLISGYQITAAEGIAGISVKYTSASFIISNCYITSPFVAIEIKDILGGNVTISENICESGNNFGAGVVFWGVHGGSIVNNTCTNFSQGIHINLASSCIIKNNSIFDSSYQGINIRYSDENIITGNYIKNCIEHGVALVGTSHLNIIHNNTIINCSQVETYHIDGERYGQINSYGYDEGPNNKWYDEENKRGNCWSDYSGSGPYSIDGPANAEDIYPNCSQTQVNPINSIYYFVALFITLTASIIIAKRKNGGRCAI